MITVWEVLAMSSALGVLTFLAYEFFAWDMGESDHRGAVRYAAIVAAGAFCLLSVSAGFVTLLDAV